MNQNLNDFMVPFSKEDKPACVDMVLGWLSASTISIPELYECVLGPALNSDVCSVKDRSCIWREHSRTSIIRTIIECAYPYVIRTIERVGERTVSDNAIVVCPPEEYHEIGARMVCDFFTLSGFNALFIGANTPAMEIAEAVKMLRPKYVAISVTNYYNMFAAKKTIQLMRENRERSDMKVIVGGQALEQAPDLFIKIGADLHLRTFKDISELR